MAQPPVHRHQRQQHIAQHKVGHRRQPAGQAARQGQKCAPGTSQRAVRVAGQRRRAGAEGRRLLQCLRHLCRLAAGRNTHHQRASVAHHAPGAELTGRIGKSRHIAHRLKITSRRLRQLIGSAAAYQQHPTDAPRPQAAFAQPRLIPTHKAMKQQLQISGQRL